MDEEDGVGGGVPVGRSRAEARAAGTVTPMVQRVAEDLVRPRRFGPKVVLRIDLHGVSRLGPGDRRTVIRWEWIEAIDVDDGVTVRSASDEVRFPRGAFGTDAGSLAAHLQNARSIEHRPEVIGRLNAR